MAQHAIVVCDERIVSLDDFEGTMTAVFHCICTGFPHSAPEYARFALNIAPNAYETMALTTRRRHCRREPIRLAGLLFRTRVAPDRPHYSASDPGDIFFAILGIICDGKELGLTADYSKTVEEVFTSATKALIGDGDLHQRPFHLDRCVPCENSGRPDSLPTWVPDWKEIGRNGTPVYEINYFEVFNATAGMNPPPKGQDNSSSRILRRPGCYVDVITEVMQPPRWIQADEWSASRISDYKGWLKSIIKFAGLGPESSPAEDYVWRTVMVDRRDGCNRPNSTHPTPLSEDILRCVRNVMRQESITPDRLTAGEAEFVSKGIIDFPKVRPDLDALDKQLDFVMSKWPAAIGSAARGRTLFKTAKAMFGLGHVAIRPGDIVTLLWGISSPIILRARKDDSIDSGYTFSGDAYVDGIMQGEFLDTKPTEVYFDIL